MKSKNNYPRNRNSNNAQMQSNNDSKENIPHLTEEELNLKKQQKKNY